MSRIRPSLILRPDIDEREYDDDLVSMIKRSYSYISPSVVTSHPATGEDVENTIRYDVKLYANYWDENDPQAAAQWDEVMPKWLHNMFYKVGSTIVATNKMARERRNRPLYYEWTELQFGENMRFAFKTREDCSLDDASIADVQLGRHLACAGQLGEGVACIRIPSRASYEAQKAAIVEQRRAAQEQAAAQADDDDPGDVANAQAAVEAADAVNAGGQVQEPEADAPFAAPLAMAAQPEGGGVPASAVAGADESAVGQDDQEPEAAEVAQEPDEAPSLPHVNFDPDTRIWGIEYADGTVREYDSETRSFVE